MCEMTRHKAPRTIETLTHADASRKHIPTAEFRSVMDRAEQSPVQVAYERRNRDLDPQLVWRGKDAQDAADLVVQALAPLHPGEGPPQGARRRPAARDRGRPRALGGGGNRGPARPVRRFQRPA